MPARTIGQKSSLSSSSSSSSLSSSSLPLPDESPDHKKHKESEESEEIDKCAICLDEMNEEQEIRKLDCKHKFHKDCINTSIRWNRSCPLCKKYIKTNERILQPIPYNSARDKIINKVLRPPNLRKEYEDDIDNFAKTKTEDIIRLEEQGPIQFLGVIVFYRNGLGWLEHLKTYSNIDLSLNIHSTKKNLTEAVLKDAINLGMKCNPFTTPKVASTKNSINRTIGLEIFSDKPRFTIDKMYFGTPAGIKNGYAIRDYNYVAPDFAWSGDERHMRNCPSNIHGDMPNHCSKQLDFPDFTPGQWNIFLGPIGYYTKVSIDDMRYDSFRYTMESIYYSYMRKAKSQVLYASEYDIDYPALNAVLDRDPPIAWIIIELGCGYYKNKDSIGTISGGGKTRRNKLRRKQNKSQRRRNRL